MDGFSQQERLEEHVDQNLELMLELATLKEKSKYDDSEKLKLSKALLAKKEYLNLNEDGCAEVFLDHAFKCTQALKEVAETLSPNSTKELLSGTFTPKDLKKNPYIIPKSKQKNPENQAGYLAWHGNNYPSPAHKLRFNIGCENRPKVINIDQNDRTISNKNFVLQGFKNETTVCTPVTSTTSHQNVNYSSLSSFQSMNTSEPMDEVEDSMISPGAKVARDARRAALAGNGIQGPGTTAGVQAHQVTEDVRQGHLGGGHQNPQQQVGDGHPSPTQSIGNVRHAPQQPGGGVRQDHPQRGGDSLDQSTSQDPSALEEAAKEAEAITANKALRIAIEATIMVKQIQVEAIYPQILDEVVLAGSIGREILMDMLKEATGGTNPGPWEGDDMTNFTQNDVMELAARLVAKKKLAKEAIQANTEAETAANDATRNAEEAERLAQSAKDEQARLVE